MYQVEEWVITKQLGTRPTFSDSVHTTLRLDIVLWSPETTRIIAVELIKPLEESLYRPMRRRQRY